ncbi:unnamed protein product [Spodoptera littoralis]|uniref:Uncharacterized protein n=1 Tax=Spodoptera littoralis TaxID=7109 RepID=A0A9P0II03_SPOLI|nr:unnamed protein product [Spodoptera littoralis]CAH1647313.1 unnamed protein product [Spodoptera littoralis]
MDDNITIRKYRRTSSLNDISADNCTLFDTTMLSLRDSSINASQTVLELHEKLEEMSNNIESAHAEIDNLNAENTQLKSDLQKCRNIIDTYKKINSTEIINMTPLTGRKRKIKTANKNLTPFKIIEQITQTCNTIDQKEGDANCEQLINKTPNTRKEDYQTEIIHNETVLSMQQAISNSEQQLAEAKLEIATLNKQIHILQQVSLGNRSDVILSATSASIIPRDNNVNTVYPIVQKRNKLCILSNCDRNCSIRAIEEIFGNHFECCRYLLTNGSIERLLNNISNKLLNYNINDYCIIMLGNTDIKTSSNYIEFVKVMRKSLQHITNTNIIICSPTYICGAPIYNYKVELFNNLLYQDLQKENSYAYYFDSNSYLAYDMFTSKTGQINTKGIKTLYNNIMENIKIDIKIYGTVNDEKSMQTDTHHTSTFTKQPIVNNERSCTETTTKITKIQLQPGTIPYYFKKKIMLDRNTFFRK